MSSDFGFDRLFDRVERIPPLPSESIWTAISSFHSICSREWRNPDGLLDINPTPLESRRWDAALEIPLSRSKEGIPNGTFALCQLLNTPRTLKQSLRRTWDAWLHLHGEVNFEDLLVCNGLRYGAPDAFAFLREHVDVLRSHDDNALNELNAAWDTVSTRLDGRAKAAKLLLTFLFPNWGERTYGIRTGDVPQGICSGSRYWRYIETERVETGGLPDQQVLRKIAEWKQSGELSGLGRDIINSQTLADCIEYFGELTLDSSVNLSAKDIRSLASQVFALLLSTANQWPLRDSGVGFFELWRLAIKKRNYRDHVSWLCAEVDRAFTSSLRFVADLLYYWGNVRNSLITQNELATLRNHLVSIVSVECDRIPLERLANSVSSVACYPLYWLFHGETWHDQVALKKPEDWHPLLKPLCAAARAFPEQALVPLIIMVHESDRSHTQTRTDEGAPDIIFHTRPYLDITFVKAWARGNDQAVSELLHTIDEAPQHIPVPDSLVKVVDAVRADARSLLS